MEVGNSRVAEWRKNRLRELREREVEEKGRIHSWELVPTGPAVAEGKSEIWYRSREIIWKSTYVTVNLHHQTNIYSQGSNPQPRD